MTPCGIFGSASSTENRSSNASRQCIMTGRLFLRQVKVDLQIDVFAGLFTICFFSLELVIIQSAFANSDDRRYA